jgi:Na+:H+ antiporter
LLVLKGSPIINSSSYSAVVIMVIVTTLVTPPVLKITLARGERIKQFERRPPLPTRIQG